MDNPGDRFRRKCVCEILDRLQPRRIQTADDEITYPVTLGLVGTYYIVVTPVPSRIEDGQNDGDQRHLQLAVGPAGFRHQQLAGCR